LDDQTLSNGVNLYRVIRKIHLIATLVLATFIFMYFVTGFMMIFEAPFPRENIKVVKIKERIDDIRSIDADSLVRWSTVKYNLRGQHKTREYEDRIVIDFSRPGTTASLEFTRQYDSVYVEIRKANFNMTMNQFHRLHGYSGGWNYFLWAFVYDLSSTSMIIFSVTGFYLWYKTERRRLAGWLVLAASTILTFSTIFYLMYN